MNFVSGQKILVATGQDTTEYYDLSYHVTQILDISTTTQTCTIKNYPIAMWGAMGAIINNSPLICGVGIHQEILVQNATSTTGQLMNGHS